MIMENGEVSLKHLFQQEFSKMVAVISSLFGLQHIETAEDIVSETFLQAAESWGMKGVPPNPTAWLYVVAKQKTLYHFRRDKIFQQKIVPALTKEQENEYEPAELNFSPGHIRDSQLQMLFAICTPAIASEAQIGLALRILCGFGIDEIAEAFLSNKETINKRLFRAKEKLREEKVELQLPPAHEIPNRLDNVLHIIYLLFNEGYYSKTNNRILQKDFCLEALRLALLLTEFEHTNLPKTNALISLMCFHASRFNARQTDNEVLVLYEQQDTNLWDAGLIRQGIHYLDLATEGEEISSYHLEAKIAWWHCVKEDVPGKWEDILECYTRLMRINFSPGVALNRVYAIYKVRGRQAALAEAEKLNMDYSHFYFLLLGELYKGLDSRQARANLEKAYDLARTQPEKQNIRKKMESLD
jgi:RNA polymerase sigma factor (sigma-70 family)